MSRAHDNLRRNGPPGGKNGSARNKRQPVRRKNHAVPTVLVSDRTSRKALPGDASIRDVLQAIRDTEAQLKQGIARLQQENEQLRAENERLRQQQDG